MLIKDALEKIEIALQQINVFNSLISIETQMKSTKDTCIGVKKIITEEGINNSESLSNFIANNQEEYLKNDINGPILLEGLDYIQNILEKDNDKDMIETIDDLIKKSTNLNHYNGLILAKEAIEQKKIINLESLSEFIILYKEKYNSIYKNSFSILGYLDLIKSKLNTNNDSNTAPSLIIDGMISEFDTHIQNLPHIKKQLASALINIKSGIADNLIDQYFKPKNADDISLSSEDYLLSNLQDPEEIADMVKKLEITYDQINCLKTWLTKAQDIINFSYKNIDSLNEIKDMQKHSENTVETCKSLRIEERIFFHELFLPMLQETSIAIDEKVKSFEDLNLSTIGESLDLG